MKVRLDINNKAHRQRIKYVVGDFVMSNVAWFTFNILRYQMGAVIGWQTLEGYLKSNIVLLGQIFFPLMMMVTYIFSGYYNNVVRKSRVQELLTTGASATINTLLIFFAALINDVVGVRTNDYEMILVFDAYKVKGGSNHEEEVGGIKIVYTKEDETADTYIEQLSNKYGRKRNVYVITSDSLIRLTAASFGCHVMPALDFENELKMAEKSVGKKIEDMENTEKSYLFDGLDAETKKKIDDIK